MLRLGLRLTVAGGKEAIVRLAMITIAVAIGTALLLTTLAGINALHAQDARYAWLETAYVPEAVPDPSADPLWWRLSADHFDGKTIARVDVAATGPGAPLPPGLAALPAAGQYVASPALVDLLATVPSSQLADRYPGELAGVIGDRALPAPNSLVVVVGHTVDQMTAMPGARPVTAISTVRPSRCDEQCALGVGYSNDGMTLTLSVVVAALLFPILIFIAGATRLSAARREQRFAAMRLVGASPRQIATIATVESGVAAAGGVVAGFVVFIALRPLVARVPFTGDPFFPRDLSLSIANVLAVAIGIPIGAAVAARLALRRVDMAPLGVARRTTPRRPRAWRTIPLLAGLAELAYLAFVSDIGERSSSTTQAYAYLGGILTVMAGLVVAGPWLTLAGSRLVAHRARRPASLIAVRRLADNPHAGFRAVSGLVIALFVGSCAIGVLTSVVANQSGQAGDGAATAGSLVSIFDRRDGGEPLGPAERDRLTSIEGVRAVVELRLDPSTVDAWGPAGPPPLLVACGDLATLDGFGHCPVGASVAEIRPDFGGGIVDRRASMSDTEWPPSEHTATEIDGFRVGTLIVGTDGSQAAIEAARTAILTGHSNAGSTGTDPQTRRELNAHTTRDLENYRRLATVVIVASLPIAGCSLAVSIAAGLADRRRSFSLLRLTGSPVRLLRRVVLLESTVPMVLGALLAIGAGFLSAALFLRAQTDYALVAPGASFYLVASGGLVAALAVIASTLPLLRRLTGPEAARSG